MTRHTNPSEPAFDLGRWWLWSLPLLFGALLGTPLVATDPENQALPDQEVIGYDKLVDYLSRQRATTRGPGGVVPADPLRITVTFDFDRVELTPLGRRQLDELARALQAPEVGNRRIEMAGHCDERGGEQYNLRLSERRVESAVNYLSTKHRIAQGRVVGLGYGESQPKIPNARTEPEHAANRRVEIRLLDGPAPAASPAPVPSPPAPGASPPAQRGLELGTVSGSRGRLAIEWGVFRTDAGRMRLIAHDGTASLRSGDEYRIYVRPDTPCYVYVYQIDSTGDGAWLFPRAGTLVGNPLPMSDFWIPDPDRSFRLASLPGSRPIDEDIHLVASTAPIPELERLLADPDADPRKVIDQFASRGQRVVPKRPRTDGENVVATLSRIESAEGAGWLRHVIRFGHEAP
ncbi:MAG: OmpA family protein [bacterium]|nr:OmpA family protein [bacterium]